MSKQRKEAEGQLRFVKRCRECGWYTKKLHGSKYQSGLPDLLLIHKLYGVKFVEMKQPGEPLRSTQKAVFYDMWSIGGAKIWVLHDEDDYDLLFEEPNWMDYVSNPRSVSLPKGFTGKAYRRDKKDIL
jgi:hypothetical protein